MLKTREKVRGEMGWKAEDKSDGGVLDGWERGERRVREGWGMGERGVRKIKNAEDVA